MKVENNNDYLVSISGSCNTSFTIKMTLYTSMILGGAWMYFMGGYFFYAGFILLGVAFAHGVELQHQVLHGGAFSNNIVNRIVGFLLGAPMLVSYSNYKASHLIHHAKVGTKDDTEFFEFNTLDGSSNIFTKLISFFLITHYIEFFKRVFKALLGKDINDLCDQKTNKQIRNEYIMMLVIIIVAIVGLAYFEMLTYLGAWLLPLFLVASPLHTLIEFPEHFGCNNESENVLENTRSIRASSFMVWYTNGNNYHVEHHMYPLVRPEKLSIVHRRINQDIQHTNHSYSEFFFESI
ncbi:MULTISPECIES: fatty acid desaturase family protein [Aliivibrio]|uniref:Fatty acid desaturase n=2 Tax=Aliivibrio TaxID=511678 RepID=A0A4V1Z8X2_9GAMM|nr:MULTISPECIES: fatty acid desaturase [Aliivibrio]MDD9177714.1 fatty acid desaturase [Aliivibrio sp. A6]PQJ93814.1 hypothetical protein BTO23_06920 [Aliivibrio sifiae]RYU50893.1 fatty acid desaturase [Aliivibrio finisterrensis]RYU51934.1 fatty acid desaturase [Aliivibrio finisterrensis]RYU56835.1 fatty acid desaturase [Aliivibrio finisterrensis]